MNDIVNEDEHEEEPVVLVDYDPQWAAVFEREAACLRFGLEPYGLVGIEHVGSTAIGGIAAKPIVDIVAGVSDMSALPHYNKRFWLDLGYRWRGEQKDDWLYFLKRTSNGERISQLHVTPYGGTFWRNIVAFRDALQGDRGKAQAYANLKATLAEQYRNERLDYRDAKATFVKHVLESTRTGESASWDVGGSK